MSRQACVGASALVLAASFVITSQVAWAQAVSDTPAPPQAQDPDSSSGEIVVTAQRRAERLVDVPITVTTLSGDQLSTANARDLVDIAKVTPSLRFDSAGGFVQPTIRGIGTAVVTSGGGSNVGLYVDGFYSPNPLATNAQLMNVDSVQVLKGPQGTLFGRNTTGGAILIQTSEPSEEAGGSFKLAYGRFDDALAQFYGTTGIMPGVAIDVEGMFRHGDGFQTNTLNGDERVGEYTSYSVRTGLKVDIGGAGSLLLRYMHADVDDPRPLVVSTYVDPVIGPGVVLAPPGLFTTKPDEVAKDQPGLFTSKSDTVQATLKLDLGFADLASYTQYRSEDVDQSQDLDATGAPIFQIGIPVRNKTISQEILLNSKPGNPLQWTGGLFYFKNKDRYRTFNDTRGRLRDPFGATRLGGSSTTTESYAAFADATYELSSSLFVTAGARYAHDRVTDAYYNVGPTKFFLPSIKNDKVTPRFVIRYKPIAEASIYASYTQGYKAAVIDAGGSCQYPPTFVCNNVKPEKLNAYEIGAKYDSRIISLEAAAFYYDYKNLQVSSYSGEGHANITNAASSEIYGLEGSARLNVTEGLVLAGGASWTHARYKKFNDAPVYLPATFGFQIPNGTTLRNVPMQRTPKFTGNLSATYTTELARGELQLSSNIYYTSKIYFGPSGTQFPQRGYEVLSARLQWSNPSDTITTGIWSDNLTNDRHLLSVQYNSFGLGANWNAPTTYGADVTFKF